MLLWDANTDLSPAKKLIQFIDSLENDRKEEHSRLTLDVFQNKVIDHDDPKVLEKCLDLLQKHFGKNLLEDTSDTWNSFVDIKMNPTEKAGEFIRRYEMLDSKMKSLKVGQPDVILAVHLLRTINLSQQEKRIVISQANTKDLDKTYESVRKSIQEMKCNIVENVKDETNATNAYFGNFRDSRRDKFENRDSRQNQPYYSHRSKSNGNNDRRSLSRHDRRDNNSYRDNSRSQSRNRTFSKNRQGDNRNRDFSRSRYRFNSQGNKWRSPQQNDNSDNQVQKTYTCESGDQFLNKDVMETRSINIGIIDCGCPSNVMGKRWFTLYEESLNGITIDRKPCNKRFKFGPSGVFSAIEMVKLPIHLGSLTSEIEVSVVDCDIPLLISSTQLEEWQVNQDYKNRILHIGKTKESVNLLKLDSGHYGLDMGKAHDDPTFERCFYGLTKVTEAETYKKIK